MLIYSILDSHALQITQPENLKPIQLVVFWILQGRSHLYAD